MATKSNHPDYGNNQPTGGTKANTGKINPQAPTSGTENTDPTRKRDRKTTAKTDTDQNAGDVQDESGNLNPGASATPGAGAGNTQGQHSFRCADAGFADCRWETSMAS